MRCRLLGILLCISFLGGCSSRHPYRLAKDFHARFEHAAVAADHEIASAAGAEILARGGNAVDAAVATSFTLSVVRPMSCGIGGGGFMIIKFHNDPKFGDQVTALNYRESTPGAVYPEFYEKISDRDATTVGGKAVAVPGTVRGLLQALESYGTLDRATVMAPAIRAAEAGFIVDQYYLDAAKSKIKWFNEVPSRKSRFSFVWKRFFREGNVKLGDRIRLPEQAEALRLIARDGAAAFYDGEIGRAIVQAIQNDGGVMTAQDLSGYQVRTMITPIEVTAFGRTLLGMPPPSSGGTAIRETLQIFQLAADRAGVMIRQPGDPDRAPGHGNALQFGQNVELTHIFVESLKHAFADRSRWLADPNFGTQIMYPFDAVQLNENAGAIGPATLPSDRYGTPEEKPETKLPADGGTSHFCVVDPHGNAVACTETINLSFGSKLAVEKYGFCLNDEMDDFTTRRGVANDFKLVQSERNMPQPGKRPLSSMSPTIVLDPGGGVFMIAGASGGPRIITGTLQAMLNVLIWNSSAGDAVKAPRIHHQWQPDVLEYEKGALTAETIAELKQKGHALVAAKEEVGNVQLIRRSCDGKGWDAACDPRKGGRPAGF